MTDSQPEMAAFMAAAEYAILEAPHGSDHEASESLISAGCFYAPRLLAAVETVLEKATEWEQRATGMKRAADLDPGTWDAHAREAREAIRGALLGEGE